MNHDLVLNHMTLADILGAKCRQIPLDDARQEAAVALVKAARTYSPERGVKFGTFARNVIRNHLFDVSGVYAPIQSVEQERREDLNAEQTEALKAAMAKLMPDVRMALEMRYGETPATLEQIGTALGGSHSYARAVVAAGLATLREILE
jgi:RNA polymerase sigma factor (sigma-70 family)